MARPTPAVRQHRLPHLEPPADPAASTLAGTVEHVTYHNPDTGFCVVRIKTAGQRRLVPVVGCLPAVEPGEWLEASGRWTRDPRHGVQFRAEHMATQPPSSAAAVERFLGSGLIAGIGPVQAQRLVQVFGAELFAVIERSPDRLRQVPGIGPERARRLVQGWTDHKAVRELMLFLHQHGVSASLCLRIFHVYGSAARARIEADPYALCRDLPGVGFATADALARRLGLRPDSAARLRAGLRQVLADATAEGHCALPHPDLVARACRLLGVAEAPVNQALARALAAGELVEDTVAGRVCVFPAALDAAERAIAVHLRRLLRGRPPWPVPDPDVALRQAEFAAGVSLADEQRAALIQALGCMLLVLTGGPGVGKTTLLAALLRTLALAGVRVALAAPTGRAARRLAEGTGLDARTLHRLLEVDPASGRFRRNACAPLDAELVVVDEASMIDVPMMAALLEALPDRAALLLAGDVDQLPSVGPGRVLADLIGSGRVPVVRLTCLFRQAAGSRIIAGAHRIREGLLPEPGAPGRPSDFLFVPAGDDADIAARIRHLVAERIP